MSDLPIHHQIFLDIFQADVDLLEIGEAEGLRYEMVEMLIDFHNAARNMLTEYRDRLISAQGLKQEMKMRLIQYMEDRRGN